MKRIALISFAAMAALMSCQKEGLIEKAQSNEPLVFTASIASDLTKTTLTYDKPAKICWESTDTITIKDEYGHSAVYKLTKGAGTSIGTFEFKSGTSLTPGCLYKATYGTNPLANQIYSASGSVPLYMGAAWRRNADGLTFTAQCGVLRVQLMDDGDNYKIMRIEVSDGTNTYKLTAPEGVDVSSPKDFYLALPAGTYTSLNIYDDQFRMISKTGSIEVKTGNVKPALNSSSLSEAFIKCSTKGFMNGHAVVRLWEGGPFWAETNIGATTETEYGQYFAWGYPDGCVRNSDNTGWVLAKDGTPKTFDSNGFPDFQTHEYTDMAAVNLGSGWSVPTADQLATLVNDENADPKGKCSIELVNSYSASWSRYQVYGLLVTGKGAYASNSIFLPGAGYSKAEYGVEGDTGGSKLSCDNNYGRYWSKDYTAGDFNAYYLNFAAADLLNPENLNFIKYGGLSVRPVYSPK